jgi:hypothetical protein
MNIFFGKKTFVRKKNSQNVFWINWGSSGEHEEKFFEVEKGEKGKNFGKKVNSLTDTKLVVLVVVVSVVVLFFF